MLEGGGGRDPAAAGKQREVFAEFPRELLREVRRQIQKYFVMETRPREIKYRDEEDEVASRPQTGEPPTSSERRIRSNRYGFFHDELAS